MGRVARRASAAVRATLGEPARLQAVAVDLALPISGLRSYLAAGTEEERARAMANAENALELATGPARPDVVPIESLVYSAADAVAQARDLSGELEGVLKGAEPNFSRAHTLLQEALGLLEHALNQGGPAR